MRIFGIIMAVVLGLLLLGFCGYWLGGGVLWGESAIFAEVNDRGDLEITARSAYAVDVQAVHFNDRADCWAPYFYQRSWYFGGGNWRENWQRTGTASIKEGDIVVAPFNRAACGDKIVKAEVMTSRGTFVFNYPGAARNYMGDRTRVPLIMRWLDRAR